MIAQEPEGRRQMTNIIELEEISVCPECHSRSWLIVETRSSNGPFCRCKHCGWEAAKSLESPEGATP